MIDGSLCSIESDPEFDPDLGLHGQSRNSQEGGIPFAFEGIFAIVQNQETQGNITDEHAHRIGIKGAVVQSRRSTSQKGFHAGGPDQEFGLI